MIVQNRTRPFADSGAKHANPPFPYRRSIPRDPPEPGDDIALIEPRVWWGGFRRVFQDLAGNVRKRDFTAETGLEEQARRLGLDARFLPQRPPRRAR